MGKGGEGRVHTPAQARSHVAGSRSSRQQQRRGRGNISMASTEEGPMHHGVEVVLLMGVAGLPARLEGGHAGGPIRRGRAACMG